MRKVTSIIFGIITAVVLSFSAFAGEWKQEADGRWWYQHDDGSFTTNNWELIDGKYYYFDAEGWMLANTTTPDGYQVGADGAWIQNEAQNSTATTGSVLSTEETHAAALTAKLNQKYHIINMGSMHAGNVTYHGSTYRCVTVSYTALTVLGAESRYKDAAVIYDGNGDIVKLTYDLDDEDGWPYDLQIQILKMYTNDIGNLDRTKILAAAAIYLAG